MADVFSAIILNTDYWDGTLSWGGETTEGNRDTKYSIRRYTSSNAWSADRDGASSGGDDEHGVISGAWASVDANGVDFDVWAADAVFLECPLTLPDGNNPARHNGILSDVTNSYLMQTTKTNLIQNNSVDNLTIDGLQVRNTTGNCIAGAQTGGIIKNNILVVANTNSNGIVCNNTAITIEIFNNIIYCDTTQGANTEGIYLDAVSTALLYNNTVWNFNDGIERDLGTVTCKNNVVFLNVTDFDGTMTLDYNASDDGTGTNAQTLDSSTNYSNEFTDITTDDSTLVSGGVCEENGLTDPGSGLFSDDIIGTSRPQSTNWDISAFELIAGGVTHQLAGTVESHSSVSGTLNLIQRLSASLNSHSQTSGVLRLIQRISGSLNSNSIVSGTIRLIHGLSGVINSASQITGSMRLIQRVRGTINSISALTGKLILKMRISGSVESHSHLSGTLVDDTILNIDTIVTTGIISRKLISTGIIDRELITMGIVIRELATTGTIQRKLQTTGDLE